MASQAPFPVPFLGGLMSMRTQNLTVAMPAYCPLECLDVSMAQDAIFFMVVFLVTTTIGFWGGRMLVHQPRIEQPHKDILRCLTRTPNAKRDEQLERLCKVHRVEYIEVEDDAAEPVGGYEESISNVWAKSASHRLRTFLAFGGRRGDPDMY